MLNEPQTGNANGGSPTLVRSPWLRAILFGLGCACVLIGAVGLILPLVPGVVFLILAAAFFARSSPRFEAWLVGHPVLGPPIRTWRGTGAIPRRAKWWACASLVVSWILLYASGAPAFVAAGMVVVFVAVAAYIVTRPDAEQPTA